MHAVFLRRIFQLAFTPEVDMSLANESSTTQVEADLSAKGEFSLGAVKIRDSYTHLPGRGCFQPSQGSEGVFQGFKEGIP